MRKLFLLALVFGSAFVQAQEPIHGKMQIAFGWVKQKDGTKKSVKGLTLDYTATPTAARSFTPTNPVVGKQRLTAIQRVLRGPSNPLPTGSGRPGPLAAEQLIYSSETAPSTPGYIDPNEFIDPSSLDDITINSAGVGKVWSKMRWGIHVEGTTTRRIIIRFRIFDTQTTAPPGQSDFIDELADFGAYMTPVDPNIAPDYLYEASGLGMAQAGVSLPDTTAYFAIQFRSDADPTGEGAFQPWCYNLYQTAVLPSIGSTVDGWYYDSDPLDGIYEDTEFDVFSTQPPPFANLLLSAFVNTNSQTGTGVLTAVNTSYGFYQTGDIISLFFSDTNTYDVRESFQGARNDPNMGIDVSCVLPTNAPLSIRVQHETQITNQESVMKTYMYRYTGTPGWVEISSRPTLPGVTVNSDILYGGSVPLAQFVGPSNVAKMRIVAFRNPQGSRAPAVMKVNRVGWTVTY